MIRHIVVPTDFSAGADAALQLAIELARPFGATIELLHVYQVPAYAFPDGSVYVTPPETAAAIVRGAMEALEATQRRAAAGELTIATQLVEGPPVDAIVDASRRCDLIVMGTHGRTGLRHLFLGSVAERVVRQAHSPVLTVRSESGAASRDEDAISSRSAG
jgi:nucleotide-binding universal stress UspA family protein